jgi:RNA polymerase sigma factor (sigma-70 family)
LPTVHAIATTELGTAPGFSAGRRLPTRLLHLAGDERLVNQVRAGSVPAFDALYDRHHRGVLAFCRHMVGSAEEAEDAVQHTFMVAYRELAETAKPVHLRPWLYAIARNRCLSVLRMRREQPVPDVPEPATEHLAAEVQRREDLRDLLRDLARLPDDQRAALVLAELGDVPHDEISHVLGCPREKVKALVFQARSSLHASRAAREAPCKQIREQLANLRGGSLRRNALRRHLRECPGCREFRRHVRSQRRALAVILPVAPTAGLKEAVLGSALGGGAASGAGVVAVGGAACGTGTFAAKALVVVTVAGGGAAAGTETLRHSPAEERAAPAIVRSAPADPSGWPLIAARAAAPIAAPAPERAATEESGRRALTGVTVEPKAGGEERTAPVVAKRDAPASDDPAPGPHGPHGPAPGQPGGAPAPAGAPVVGGADSEPEVLVEEEGAVDPPEPDRAAQPEPSPEPPPVVEPDPVPVPDPPVDPPIDPPPAEEDPGRAEDPPPVVDDPVPEPTPDPTPDP